MYKIIMYKIIIVIGLPGSGKTTFCNKYLNNYIVYDDFITNFYNTDIINNLKNNIKICVNDPRLCNYDIFIRYMNIFTKYVNKKNILLILLKKNLNKCIKNILLKNDNKNVYKTFLFLYIKYNLTNYILYNEILIR